MELALMFIVLIALILLNTPVAYAIFTSSMIYVFVEGTIPLRTVAQRMISGPDSFPLIAVPFFILAGQLMNECGITEEIFDFARTLVGHIPGGLGHVNVVASIIFSGMSGAAIADAGGLGAIEIKAMKDEGYDEDFAVAITAASSIIGPIMPPSLPAVVYAVLAGVSMGALLIAGIIPAFVMALALMIMVYIYARDKDYKVYERSSIREIARSFIKAFLPLLTPIILIGGIITGVFTPTEAAVVAAFYAFLLATVYYRNMGVKNFRDVIVETSKTTATVLLIVASASMFGWILSRERLPQMLAAGLLDLTQSRILILLIINVFLLFVGTFMETIAALNILVPFLSPLVVVLGIDPLHFGVVMILNLMIGLLTPPLGMVLYVLVSVADVEFERAFKATLPFIIPLIITLLIITFNPVIVTYLPRLSGLY